MTGSRVTVPKGVTIGAGATAVPDRRRIGGRAMGGVPERLLRTADPM